MPSQSATSACADNVRPGGEWGIWCEGLDKSFDGIRSLDAVSFRLPSVGVAAVIGPNGAGKTTLLNVLTGYLRPDAGHCFVRGRDVTCIAPYRIARLGVARTFQLPRVVRQLPTIENVLLARPGRRNEGMAGAVLHWSRDQDTAADRGRAWEALEAVGLGEHANDLAGDLSFGEQKALTLAMALAADARVFLLDEPVAGLFRDTADKVLAILAKLRDEKRLVVLIEHDIDAVRRVADEVLVMACGRLIAQGPTEEVLANRNVMEAYFA